MPKRGLGLECYGIPGIGKTMWALQWPKPLYCFSIYETGYDDFEYMGKVPQGCVGFNPETYETLINLLNNVLRSDVKSRPATIVIDTVSGFQQIFFNYLIRRDIPQTKTQTFEESEANFWAYYKGPRQEAPTFMPQFTSILTSLLNLGVHVVLLGHRKGDTEENVSGADYKRAVIDMDEGIRNCLNKWAPNILYMNLNTSIATATKTSGYGQNTVILEGKASQVADRIIFTSTNPQNDAKNKLGLPSIINMGNSPEEAFAAFWQHVPQPYKE